MSAEIPQALVAMEALFARQRLAFTAAPMPSEEDRLRWLDALRDVYCAI